MKLSAFLLAGVVSANEKKVPPRHPIQRLHRLVEFAGEILYSDVFDDRSDKWVNMWSEKFSKNADRMQHSFTRGNQRCGFYDEK